MIARIARTSNPDEQRQGNSVLQAQVDTLRKREVSWAEIGEALGISRQAAWERFS
jgi:ATP-dependent Clp protease ATP-binding subunit ClpX